MPQQLNFDDLSEVFAKRLIYVIGSARGGSTLANRAIGAHPDVLEVRWNDKTFSDIWPELRSLSDEALRAIVLDEPRIYDPAAATERIGAENVDRFMSHVERVCRRRDLRSFLCLRGILAWIRDGAGRAPEELLAWCLKANTWQGIDRVKQAIPEARLVFVQRDPRSTSLSFAKVYARRSRQKHFNDHDVVHGAMSWLRNAVEFAVLLSRYADAHLVYFEDLIDKPVPALNKLYAKLKLDEVEESHMKGALANVRYSATHAHEERGKSTKVSGIQDSARDRWRSQLTDEQVQTICALTGPAATYYGYTLGSCGGLAQAFTALNNANGAMLPKYLALYLYARARLMRLERLTVSLKQRELA